MTKKILVTGGFGYIGSHVVLELKQAGYSPIVVDDLSTGNSKAINLLDVPFYLGSFSDPVLLDKIFLDHDIFAVMHFAAKAYVDESIYLPIDYYYSNVASTIILIRKMIEKNILKIVFSSSCATYGIPDTLPITEKSICNPISPYGRSKLFIEKILDDVSKAYSFQSIIFRYFNAAGADPMGRIGECHNPETHLIPLALRFSLGKSDTFKVYGDKHNTIDGTCIRDFIHVSDLSAAHVLGLKMFDRGDLSQIYNLGIGVGFSVKNILDVVFEFAGKPTRGLEYVEARDGDPPVLFANSQKARQELGWIPRFTRIDEIISHAYAWELKNT